MKNQIQIRLFVEKDIIAICKAFNQISWDKPVLATGFCRIDKK
tara:strand:- start:8 stop:136 length:129 start_codon:yes stop_codon:yes gene_type:complete